MKQDDLIQFKKQLEEERRFLEKDLLKFADKDKKVKGDYDTRFPQIGDRSASPDEDAQEVTIYSNLLAIEHTLETRLQEINEALEKIDKHSEDFGLCEICKKPIELLRLKTNPASKTCINCAAKAPAKPAS